MIPTFIASGDGEFLGIEGHETTRKLMSQSVEQAGGLEPEARKAFETISSDAALEAMARDHWSTLARIWQNVELDPAAPNETQSVTAASPFGGERIRIIASVKFVKETNCAPGRADRRCAHFQAESGADKEQVAKIVQSLLREAGAERPVVTAWDQRVRADIVIDKATTLPQQFTLTRFHALNVRVRGGGEEGGWEEITTTYTFAWRLPNEERK